MKFSCLRRKIFPNLKLLCTITERMENKGLLYSIKNKASNVVVIFFNELKTLKP